MIGKTIKYIFCTLCIVASANNLYAYACSEELIRIAVNQRIQLLEIQEAAEGQKLLTSFRGSDDSRAALDHVYCSWVARYIQKNKIHIEETPASDDFQNKMMDFTLKKLELLAEKRFLLSFLDKSLASDYNGYALTHAVIAKSIENIRNEHSLIKHKAIHPVLEKGIINGHVFIQQLKNTQCN